MGFLKDLLAPTPRRHPRPRRPPVVRRCVDCSATLPARRGPGRAPLRCAACKTARAAKGPSWELDPAGVERVRAHFRLQHPLHIVRSNGRIQHGVYRGLRYGSSLSKALDPDARYHVIAISSQLDAAGASRNIVHEACHAMQQERDPASIIRYGMQMRRAGDKRRSRAAYEAYRTHPLEVEARAAEAHAARLKPARTPRRRGAAKP